MTPYACFAADVPEALAVLLPAGQLTGAGSIPSHLISLQAAGQDPGVILGVSPLHVPQRGASAGAAGSAAAEPQSPDLGAFVFVPVSAACLCC